MDGLDGSYSAPSRCLGRRRRAVPNHRVIEWVARRAENEAEMYHCEEKTYENKLREMR